MTTREYVNQISAVDRIIDGDTFIVSITKDIGFRFEVTAHPEIRLLGYDCPETRQGSAFERREGLRARGFAQDWMWSHPDPLWIRTEKDPDSFGRWLGEIWAEGPEGTREYLGDALRGLDLATVWPTRWHETYDPERNKA